MKKRNRLQREVAFFVDIQNQALLSTEQSDGVGGILPLCRAFLGELSRVSLDSLCQ